MRIETTRTDRTPRSPEGSRGFAPAAARGSPAPLAPVVAQGCTSQTQAPTPRTDARSRDILGTSPGSWASAPAMPGLFCQDASSETAPKTFSRTSLSNHGCNTVFLQLPHIFGTPSCPLHLGVHRIFPIPVPHFGAPTELVTTFPDICRPDEDRDSWTSGLSEDVGNINLDVHRRTLRRG